MVPFSFPSLELIQLIEIAEADDLRDDLVGHLATRAGNLGKLDHTGPVALPDGSIRWGEFGEPQEAGKRGKLDLKPRSVLAVPGFKDSCGTPQVLRDHHIGTLSNGQHLLLTTSVTMDLADHPSTVNLGA